MIRMTTTSGRPRKISVYTRAGQRNQRECEIPAIASTMPTASPITLALTVRINVLGSPVVSRVGMACRYRSQSKNDSRNWARVDFGVAGPTGMWGWLAAIAAKSGSVGAAAAFDPGFHPGGRLRGTHWQYRFAQVPSAITASSPVFSASTSGWLSLATAYATKIPGLKKFATITAASPGRIVVAASVAGATHA